VGCGIANFSNPFPVPGCTVTVSNTSFLKNGDVLHVSWAGMDATKPVYLQQCFAPNPNAAQGSSGAACSNFDTGATPSPGASGARNTVAAGSANGSADLTVHTGDQGSGTCPPPAGSTFACSVYVSQSTTAPDQRSTRVPIGFGTAAPTTSAPGGTTGGSTTGGSTGSSLPTTGQDVWRLTLLGLAAISAGLGLSYPRWSRRRRLVTIDVER
jgi:hypothetical protein